MKKGKAIDISKVVKQFIKSANEFDVDSVVSLFAKKAIIDDVSVGNKFKNTEGVRDYIDTFFVGYNTQTKIDALKVIDSNCADVRVDFTGNFGHEKGILNIAINEDGLIVKIDADLIS